MRKRKLTAKDYAESFAVASGRSTIEERYLGTKTSEVSRNLKMLRATIRMTANELSELSGLSHSLIRSVETGYRTLLLEPALLICLSTGVDLWSLMTGKILLEWGGRNPYTEDSFLEWKKRGAVPSEEQENQGSLQLKGLCESVVQRGDIGHAEQALVSGYLQVLDAAFTEGVEAPRKKR